VRVERVAPNPSISNSLQHILPNRRIRETFDPAPGGGWVLLDQAFDEQHGHGFPLRESNLPGNLHSEPTDF